MSAVAVGRSTADRRPGSDFLARGWAVLLGIYALFISLLASLIAVDGWQAAWRALGVSAASTSFLDMRSLTSGWECTRRGIDVLAANPCDPLHRPFNYPRIWTLGGPLGLGEGATVALGCAAAAIAIGALVVIGRDLSRREALAFAAVTLSPPVLLAFERGNTDLFVFGLVVAAALTAGSRPARSGVLATAAAILKLYPIAALSTLFLRTCRSRRVAYISLALFTVYVGITLHDLRLINAGTPRATAHSYGVMTAPRIVGSVFDDSHFAELLTLGLSCGVIAATTLGLVRTHRSNWPNGAIADRRLDLFRAGSAIYVATFFLGSNFEYRLIFLALTLPQLLQWARRDRPESSLARPVLLALIGYLWLKWIALAELLEWILVAGFITANWLSRAPRAQPQLVRFS